jgi:hypothetical protein
VFVVVSFWEFHVVRFESLLDLLEQGVLDCVVGNWSPSSAMNPDLFASLSVLTGGGIGTGLHNLSGLNEREPVNEF